MSTPPDLSKLTILQLKSILRGKGLTVGGNKSTLLARLNNSTSSSIDSAPATTSLVKRSGAKKDGGSAGSKQKPTKVEETAITEAGETNAQQTAPITHAPIPVTIANAASAMKSTTVASPASQAINVAQKSIVASARPTAPKAYSKQDRSNPLSVTENQLTKKAKVVRMANITKDQGGISLSSHPESATIEAALREVKRLVDPIVIQRKSIAKFKSPLQSRSPRVARSPSVLNPVQIIAPCLCSDLDKASYVKSTFLHRFYHQLGEAFNSLDPCFSPMTPQFFTTSAPEQFLVSIRFIISRIHLALSLDFSSRSIFELSKVVGAQFIVPGICKINLHDSESVYVLSMTGEVIGMTEERGTLRLKLRGDWKSYLEMAQVETPLSGDLLRLVFSSDPAYQHGLSTQLRSLSIDSQKIELATRFLFSHCHPHSISGSYESTSTSSHIYASLPPPLTSNTARASNLGFYLPSPMCVESVHLDDESSTSTSKGTSRSSELAIVQTVGQGGLIVLRMTGQSVGNETEGVGRLWREILACDERGYVVATS